MNEDKVIEKLIQIDGRLDHVVTKQEFSEFKDAHFRGQDRMIRILERVDQERLFTNEKIKHLEEDIKVIKLRLQIA